MLAEKIFNPVRSKYYYACVKRASLLNKQELSDFIDYLLVKSIEHPSDEENREIVAVFAYLRRRRD